jgi:hypothetical protein
MTASVEAMAQLIEVHETIGEVVGGYSGSELGADM